MTRATYLERRWPDARLFQQLAPEWCADHSRLLLALVWRGCDRLVENDLAEVPFSADDEAKEESLNFLLALRINECKSGDEPFYVHPEVPEQAKRKRGRGKSPQPDIGFVLYESPRSVWPLEGKVLNNERDIGPYVEEITGNFLTGRYATFSAEGAMLGYLLRGDPCVTFQCIAMKLGSALEHHPNFPERNHKISPHDREKGWQPRGASRFCCHHLLLRIKT